MADSNEMQRTTRNSIPQDGFDCIYLYENGVEVGCLNGPQNDPKVIDRAKHWERAASVKAGEAAATSVREALEQLEDFIERVRSGHFYTDYDAATESLGNADRALKALATPPAPTRERIAQALLDRFIERGKRRLGGSTFREGTKINELVASYRDDFMADADAVIEVLALLPDASAIRAAAFKEAAGIVDAECRRILSKQTTTSDPFSLTDTINMNLRMMATVLPDLAAAIRASGEK